MSRRFQVLTYNVFKFRGPVGWRRVAPAIVAQNADLMAFQEVFNMRLPRVGRNARAILERELPTHGYRPLWFRTSGPYRSATASPPT